ncbi:site-specific recombinase XerD [Blastomonas natatoria]|uniref:Site-specific recombinase XerD n=1 Tax=Blastomonas natatoria TaxID=34015 RepID=A0A2V3V2Z3_9SPHN|nr:site-specific recombinase XerD [Blastomonas natatoria]
MQSQPEYTVQRFRGGFALVWAKDRSRPIGAPGNRGRRTLYAADRAGAESEARRIWAGSDNSPWTLGRIVTAYIATLEADQKPSTQRRKDGWRAMRTFWENTDPELIDEAMCRSYADQRKASASTVRYELLMVSTAVGWARKAGHTSARPEMWLPSAPERQTRHLTHKQFEQFYAEVKAPHARLYVLLGLFTMARPSAILDLTWDRVDFDRGLIDLNPPGRKQTAKRRPVVPMNDELRAALEDAYRARQCAYVVERGGKQVANIKKAFQAASERSGIHATPYSLRHTGAVWAAEAGVSMDELAQFMGHDDAATTSRHYARYSPDYLRTVANRVQRRAS